MAVKPSKISLSADTWIKIILFLSLHGALMLVGAWKLTQQYEHRITILETNQQIFMEFLTQNTLSYPGAGKVSEKLLK
ncbi:hypothetical protein KAR91_20025 [Candidatus Pacearchaeota archaeon]|nr:hypothetical protein [Candidatus Pacearchaeota archaeon]